MMAPHSWQLGASAPRSTVNFAPVASSPLPAAGFAAATGSIGMPASSRKMMPSACFSSVERNFEPSQRKM